MEILRFIKWWWSKKKLDQRIGFLVVSWFLLVIPVGFLFGAKGLLIGIGIALFAVVVFLLYCIYRNINQKWNQYQDERNLEAQEIVNRLSGKPAVYERSAAMVEAIRARSRKVVSK